MSDLIATKSDSEKEEEEAERLVRKSPKKKPPRRDKERGRVKVDDPDLDNKDPDLSMNYKDIGGSIMIARYVASSYMAKYAASSEEEFLNTKVPSPDSDRIVKIKTLKDKPEGSLGRQTYEKYRKQWQRYLEREETGGKEKNQKQEDTSSQAPTKKKEKIKKDEKTQNKEQKTDAVTEKQINALTQQDMEDVYKTALGEGPLAEAARKEIVKRKAPLPADDKFPNPENFKGALTPEHVDILKSQIKNWDLVDYVGNMKALEENFVEALGKDNERAADYFREVQETYEQAANEHLRTKSLKDVDFVSDLYGEEANLDKPMSDEDLLLLPRKRRGWHQTAMFSSLNQVDEKLEEVEETLQKVGEDVIEGSKEHEYLKEMKDIFSEVRDRKMFDKGSSGDDLLTKIRDAQDENDPTLSALDPGDYDMTDPEGIRGFVNQVAQLDDKALARLAEGNDVYESYLGIDKGFSKDLENVSISDKNRTQFLDALHQDLEIRGFWEQVRPQNRDDDSILSQESMLAYREKALKELDEMGIDLGTGKRKKTLKQKAKSFWGTFLDWMNDMSERELLKNSAVEARAYYTGIRTAFEKAGLKSDRTKEAQYRGLPGPLPSGERLPSPKWSLPKSTQDLDLDDYIGILEGAQQWLRESYLQHILVGWDYDMACRLALDYSIYTASNYRYNGAVGVPAYNRLLDLLKRFEPPRK